MMGNPTDRPILIVTYRPGLAAELADRVRRFGYEVAATAATHDEAVRKGAAAGPDAVIVDLSVHDDAAPPFADRELRTRVELAISVRDEARLVHELDAFFAVSIDMFCFLDFSGYFRRLNPAWERTLGYTRDELMSRPFIEFVHPDDRERTLSQNADVRSGGQALNFENRYLHRDGSYRWLRWNSTPRSEDGLIYAVARDITALKEEEDERARLLDELTASLAEVSTLQAILPICTHCRKIRDDQDYWHSVEGYISTHTNSRFSHGICPECLATEYGPYLG